MGHPRVTTGHPRVTIGHSRVTIGHPRVTIGHPKATAAHPRVSKHKANTTELHPKVRQTCIFMVSLHIYIIFKRSLQSKILYVLMQSSCQIEGHVYSKMFADES